MSCHAMTPIVIKFLFKRISYMKELESSKLWSKTFVCAWRKQVCSHSSLICSITSGNMFLCLVHTSSEICLHLNISTTLSKIYVKLTSVRCGGTPEEAVKLANMSIESKENKYTTRAEIRKAKFVGGGTAINFADTGIKTIQYLSRINNKGREVLTSQFSHSLETI